MYVVGNGRAYTKEFTAEECEVAAVAAERMLDCASWLKFGDFFEQKETHLLDARFCGRAALCEPCARRRAGQVGVTYLPKFQAALEAKEGRIMALVTFTIQHVEELRLGLELIRDSWRGGRDRAKRYRNRPDRNSPTEFAKMAGGTAALEVVRSKTKPRTHWHPHLHVLAVLDDYIDQKALSEEWRQLTGGSYIVDIRRVKPGEELEGIREALKYPVKFSELRPIDCVRAYFAFRGVRERKRIIPLSSFGCTRAALPDLNGFDECKLTGPYAEWFAYWVGDGYTRRYGQVHAGATEEDVAAAKAAKAQGLWRSAPFMDCPEDQSGPERGGAVEVSGEVGEAAPPARAGRVYLLNPR